jgi:hypothetical protein
MLKVVSKCSKENVLIRKREKRRGEAEEILKSIVDKSYIKRNVIEIVTMRNALTNRKERAVTDINLSKEITLIVPQLIKSERDLTNIGSIKVKLLNYARKHLGKVYYGGSINLLNINKRKNGDDLQGLLGEGWLSNIVIDEYLSRINNRSGITLHHSDVALLLQGGSGNFHDMSRVHPIHWKGSNIIPTIIRCSEHIGVHWVLLEVKVGSRKIKLYDSAGTGHVYQTKLLESVANELKQEVPPYSVWKSEVAQGMERQKDSNNCGVFVSAWAENALKVGRIENCIKAGEEKKYRRKIYDVLTEQIYDNYNEISNNEQEVRALLGRKIDNFSEENKVNEVNEKNARNKEENYNNLELIRELDTTAKESEKMIEDHTKLDKYLNKRARKRLKLLIDICIEPLKSYRDKIVKILNGEWRDDVMFTFINYIASSEFMEKPEDITNDDTFWSWCKWAMATVNQKEQNEVKSRDLKGMQRNGNISESIMNKYIEIIGGKSLTNGIVIHNVVHVAKGFEKCNRKKLELQEVTFIPFMITNELNGINNWIIVEISMKNKKIVTYNPENIDVQTTSELVNLYTDIKKYDGNWISRNST